MPASSGSDEPRLELERRPSQDRSQEDRKGQQKSSGIMGRYQAFMDRHPRTKAFLQKLGKDNIGMLAGFVSWSMLTSLIPIMVGLIAISSLALQHNPSAQRAVIDHLGAATQGAFSKTEIQAFVKASAQHSGILGLIGFLGVLWGGSNVGGSISTAFQAIFETQGRSFLKEKLIDIGMIFVFTILMLIIIAGTSAVDLLSGTIAKVPVPGLALAIGYLVTLVAAFILFAAIYLVFPNIKPPFRFDNIWKGALVSAVLFTILSSIWPIYASFQHFNRYGLILAPLLILTAWIYFFSMILMAGAEVVGFSAIEEAKREHQSVGPQPQESVPQHNVLRSQPPAG